ncbi:MAG: iron ABC transporter permease [Pseudomonadota bacterium]
MRRVEPAVIASSVVALFVLAPVVVLFWLGYGADVDWRAESLRLTLNTLALTLLTVAGAVLIGVPLAFLTTYCELRKQGVWLALLTAPLAIPSYIGGFAYFAATGAGGEIALLTGVALPAVDGLPGTALVMTLYTFPFIVLTTRASLRQLDSRMVEAARCLGAGSKEVIARVILPRIRGGIAAGALIVALYTLSDFATPAILGFDTFTRSIFVEYNAFGLDRAALLSLQLLVLVGIVLALESRVGTERESTRCNITLRLTTSAYWLAVVFMSLVVTLTLALPAFVFAVWLARDGIAGFDPVLAWNSTYPALLAAVATVIVALPVAFAATQSRAGRLLERLATLGYGIPGIVMGTALIYVGLTFDYLYQSLALLIVGHILRFLPLAVGPLRTCAARLDKNVLFAARSLGARRLETIKRVSLPMLVPGAFAGGALVFLEVMRELPLTLLLRPTGMDTLTTELWQVYEAGYFGRAALPALCLIAISACALLMMFSSENRSDQLPGR